MTVSSHRSVHWSWLALSSCTRRKWWMISVSSLSPVSLGMLAVFYTNSFHLHLTHIALRLFYIFYCFYFIFIFFAFSADSSGCDIHGLEGGINNMRFFFCSLSMVASLGCLLFCLFADFFSHRLSNPEVRSPLICTAVQGWTFPLKRVPPLEFLSCQHWTLTSSCFLGELLSTQLLKWLPFVTERKFWKVFFFSPPQRASSQMYVVLSKHNYALSIKAIQVDWIWIIVKSIYDISK